MKDRIMNALMLFTVAAALIITLVKEPADLSLPISEEAAAQHSPAPVLDPLAAFRQKRETQRESEASMLLSLAQNPAGDQELRFQAQQQLLEMQRQNEIELRVEALLTGRGYTNAICTAEEETLLIVLETQLTQEEAAGIQRLAAEISGFSPENIRIAC